MELALGTVQFGLPYGITGTGAQVGDAEASAILAAAHEAGIRRLDTAPAYGDVEERLVGLTGTKRFDVVTKVPAVPDGVAPQDIAAFVTGSIGQSRARLGDTLAGVLFHNAADLFVAGADFARIACDEALEVGVGRGSSLYDPSQLSDLTSRWPTASMVQMPGNAYDQRIAGLAAQLDGIEVTLRSAFLQGLLLTPAAVAAQRLPAIADWAATWHGWCAERGLRPLVAALSIVKGFKGVDYCVVGVDTIEQLNAIVEGWDDALPVSAPELAGDDPAIYDPRQWSTGR